MTASLQATLGKVSAGDHLSMDEMAGAIDEIMQGTCEDSDIAALLLGLRANGETVDEVAGAAAAMRKHMATISSSRTDLIDTCGTGGDGSCTFNISTAAAIVTAAAGVPVAKHGNRGITSKTGSADVLAALGVNIEAPLPVVERCLDELGLCFCFAPLAHKSMKHVAAVRRSLGVPTIFNMLGPLCNPAGAPFQLIGVGRAELRPLLAEALAKLGAKRAVVVHGEDGLDEVTLSGKTSVSLVEGDTMEEQTWTPEDFGLAQADKDSMLVDGPEASAAMIRTIFSGENRGPARDIVVLNAAAALWTAGKDADRLACACMATNAIDTGAANALLARLAELSAGN
jgi:anthranilate phosphoribosyltransferase